MPAPTIIWSALLAVGKIAKKSAPQILAWAGILGASSFVLGKFMSDAAETALRLWPYAAMFFLLVVVRIFASSYLELKKKEFDVQVMTSARQVQAKGERE